MRSRFVTLVLLAAVALAFLAHADGPALIRVERRTDNDRVTLIESGLTLVMEQTDAFLVLGDPAAIRDRLQALGRDGLVIDASTAGWTYFAFLLRPNAQAADLAACGDPVLVEDDWALLRSGGELLPAPCIESDRWFVKRLSFRPLAVPAPLP